MPTKGRNTINSGRTGIVRADFNHRLAGGNNNPEAASRENGGVGMMAESSSNSAAPGSAIFSRPFLEADVVNRRLADSAGSRRRPSAERMSKPTSWSHLKRR